MRNETCPICGQPTVQAQVIIKDANKRPISVWLCTAHNATYWSWMKAGPGIPALDEIKGFTNGGMRPPEA